MKEFLKHLLIRTPFENPARKIQSLLRFRKRFKHPELQEIHLESHRIEQVTQRLISESSNCIDIGCHLGSMLSDILRLSPHGSHIAFEPVPYKAHWLKQKFPEVAVKEIALSDTSGKVSFYINTHLSGFSGLQPHNAEKPESLQKITVERARLDTILMPEHRVDFIKIDVEGGELAVLRGATEILSHHRPTLLFECTHSGLSSFGFTASQIFEFLTQQHSYSIFLLKDFCNNGEPLSRERFLNAIEYPFQAFNFIATAN
ncbi:FkbM family methyltransferase [Lyngbya aestuarii]|uniref:FkbM family methyltransferase n=1 Tax=Lyngbya aestuarii TaxID=118322 RepID=UPI00403DA6B7